MVFSQTAYVREIAVVRLANWVQFVCSLLFASFHFYYLQHFRWIVVAPFLILFLLASLFPFHLQDFEILLEICKGIDNASKRVIVAYLEGEVFAAFATGEEFADAAAGFVRVIQRINASAAIPIMTYEGLRF